MDFQNFVKLDDLMTSGGGIQNWNENQNPTPNQNSIPNSNSNSSSSSAAVVVGDILSQSQQHVQSLLDLLQRKNAVLERSARTAEEREQYWKAKFLHSEQRVHLLELEAAEITRRAEQLSAISTNVSGEYQGKFSRLEAENKQLRDRLRECENFGGKGSEQLALECQMLQEKIIELESENRRMSLERRKLQNQLVRGNINNNINTTTTTSSISNSSSSNSSSSLSGGGGGANSPISGSGLNMNMNSNSINSGSSSSPNSDSGSVNNSSISGRRKIGSRTRKSGAENSSTSLISDAAEYRSQFENLHEERNALENEVRELTDKYRNLLAGATQWKAENANLKNQLSVYLNNEQVLRSTLSDSDMRLMERFQKCERDNNALRQKNQQLIQINEKYFQVLQALQAAEVSLLGKEREVQSLQERVGELVRQISAMKNSSYQGNNISSNTNNISSSNGNNSNTSNINIGSSGFNSNSNSSSNFLGVGNPIFGSTSSIKRL